MTGARLLKMREHPAQVLSFERDSSSVASLGGKRKQEKFSFKYSRSKRL
jgi:hypothetical protein